MGHSAEIHQQDGGGIARLLRTMHDALAVAETAQERLDKLTHVIARHVDSDVCSIYLRLPSDQLELYSTEGLNREAVHRTRLNWGEGLVGVVAETKRPLITSDAPLHPNFAYRPETGEDPLHSFLGVPLLRSGKSLGVLVLQNLASRRYTDEEVGAAQAVATLLAEIAASGELFDPRTTAEVGEMLHRPERLSGTGVTPGVAVGHAAFHEPPTPKHKVFAKDSAAEAARLQSALSRLQASVDAMLADPALDDAPREVLETYRLFAYDRGWKERMRAAALSGLTAEAAVEQIQSENRARMGQVKDPYLRERMHDLDDLSNRLLRHLAGDGHQNRELPDEAVLIARTLGPAELLEYDRTKLKGLVLGEASATSHVAIVARALGIPIVAGLDNVVTLAEPGDEIIVDGGTGELHIRPTPEVAASLRDKQALQSKQQAAYAAERGLPSVTTDGLAIELLMNVGIPLDMANLESAGAAGVGLFRTELQFLIGAQLPRAGAQEKLYREILVKAAGKPVVFRTADLGADKAAAYMKRRAEANPAMGWRGMRMAVDRPGLFRPQIRALIAAAAGQELNVLFPMITLVSEIEAARALLDREMELRKKRGREMPTIIRLGAMIETPAAAWRIAEIARHVDFLSIGGNDLMQFYYAADRESELTQRRFDPIEPGFLSFMAMIAREAREARRPLTFCGEQAADLLTAAALIGVGVTRFSSPASTIGPFRRLVRSMNAAETADWIRARFDEPQRPLRREFEAFLRRAGVALG